MMEQLEKQVIDGEVERVHHRILPLEDRPARVSLHLSEHRVSPVAARRVDDQEALMLVGELGRELSILRLGQRETLLESVERSAKHGR